MPCVGPIFWDFLNGAREEVHLMRLGTLGFGMCCVETQTLCPFFLPLLWCSSWNCAWCVNPDRALHAGLLVLLSEVEGDFLVVPFKLVLAQYSCSLLYRKGFDLFFFSYLFEPDLGREGSQLEIVIQDLFPFHIKNLDKAFTDGLCVGEPLPEE